jgi:iron complex outermembrane receptor protein
MKVASRNRLSAAVRSALLVSLLPIVAVQAQDAPRELDRVEVTGSRIKKAEIEGQTPVQVITRVQIDETGLSSVADILQRITGSGSALNTKFNSSGNFGFPPDGGGVGAGASTVDLRHLGAKRVLVLVDGVRWVNESSASGVGGVVDLNTIPLAIVDRIEILEDGASSLYGSDAIAGVVNIITRRSLDGVQVNLSYGESDEGDGETSNAEVSFGGSGANHSFFLSAAAHETKTILSRDREISSFPVPGTGLAGGSSAIVPGRFIFRDPNTGVTLDLVPNTLNPVYDPTQTGCARTDGFRCFTNADRFNFAQFNLLQTPSKRKSVFGQGRIDLSETTSWYLKALYNNRESLNQAAPEPFFFGQLVPSNFWADNVLISAANPFNPFGFDLQAGPGGNFLLGGRRPLEGGPRQFFQDVDTYYVGTGFEGSFDALERGWFWDVNFVSSESKADQTNFGSYNARRASIALGDPAICAANPGCTPLNVFGPGSITPAMLAYIQPVLRDSSDNKLRLASANISGDLFDLPAGPLAFAAGYEYRKYKGSYRPDGLTVAGDYNGVVSQPTRGSYDVNEYFVEFNVPVYASGESQLDLSAAARYSDYSTFGGETTGKVGLRWQFSDSFLLRGTFAEGFRAPNIGELFGAASGFDAVLNDPCSGAGRPANCAQLGVPANYVQPNPQISVVTGGNPNLQPETADSFTAGFVWSPAFASDTGWSERFDIEFTYYDHEIEGGIQAIDAQTQLNLCVASLNPIFCDGIARNATGSIDGFANFLTNIGQIETSGYDLDFSWTLPSMDLGQFAIRWNNTWVDEYRAVGANGAVQPQAVGIEVSNSAIPEWTSNLNANWSYGDFDASWSVRHISDLEEACGATAASFPVCRNDPRTGRNRLGSTTYHDWQVGWKTPWTESMKLTAGINNVFEKDAPICLSCTLNGYDASTYDLPGRFWYVRADITF